MFRRYCLILLSCVWLAGWSGNARAQSSPPNLPQLAQEAQGWLGDMARINPAIPPGDEMERAKYIAAILQKESIPQEILNVAPGRGVVVGRLLSGSMADPAHALLLLGHPDVDNAMLAANLAVIVGLKRSGLPLKRDLIFLATTDQEQSGPAGMKAVIQKYWDRIACAYALNDGGTIMAKDGKVQYLGIQTSEKVPYNVTVTATGTAGRASQPPPDNAVVHLAAAIAKIGAFQIPASPTTMVLRYFEQLSRIEDEDTAKWMRALEEPVRADLAAMRLSDQNPMWNSMLRDTLAPTMLHGGARANDVPGEATANLSIHMLPGHSIEDLLAKLNKLVNDPHVHLALAPDQGANAPDSETDTPLYKTIERVTSQDFPGAIALPFLSPGATDSADLRLHRVEAYGLDPFPLAQPGAASKQGGEESRSPDSFQKGVAFLYHVVSDFTVQQ